MELVVTIDTEEDNWHPFAPEPQTRNAHEIPRLQELFEEFSIRPTYLITYPMAHSTPLVEALQPYARRHLCEIGMHCHPWNTPPFSETREMRNSMLCNLPQEVVEQKLATLHSTITNVFGTAPTSFRSGRWGYGPHVGRALAKLGYKVDTSFTAFTDWSAYHGPDYSRVGPEPSSIVFEEGDKRAALVELPATVGYLQKNFSLMTGIERLVRTKPLKWLRLVGILDALGVMNKVVLSPELSNAKQMIALSEVMMALHYPYLNLFFHSPTLVPGLTPFVKDQSELDDFYSNLRALFSHLRTHHEFCSVTASEVANAKTGLATCAFAS